MLSSSRRIPQPPDEPVNRGRRWELDDAIESSRLPALTRHVLHTLLRRADASTGEIPDEYQPSLVGLCHRTGLRHETLLRELDRAEAEGWLSRERGGGRGHRTRYTVYQSETGPDAGLDNNGSGVRTGSSNGNRSGTSAETGPLSSINRSGTRTTARSVLDRLDLSRGAARTALSAAVGEVDARETDVVLEILKFRGAKSPSAVLHREIADGGAMLLVDQARAALKAGYPDGRQSAACRRATHNGSCMSWCTCLCHFGRPSC